MAVEIFTDFSNILYPMNNTNIPFVLYHLLMFNTNILLMYIVQYSFVVFGFSCSTSPLLHWRVPNVPLTHTFVVPQNVHTSLQHLVLKNYTASWEMNYNACLENCGLTNLEGGKKCIRLGHWDQVLIYQL